MAERTEVAVIGAGPYGLAAAAYLTEAGRDVRAFGEPLRFWRTQTPTGMLLRSPYLGSDIGDPKSALTLQHYEAAKGSKVTTPIPAEDFISYGLWFQEHAVPDVDHRGVAHVEPESDSYVVTLDDGERVEARRVVVAAGVGTLGWRPPQFEALGPECSSHSLDYGDLGRLSGTRVSVIGGGQSALESAALLHEAGADVDVLVRASELHWVGAHPWTHRWPLGSLLYAPADVGPAGMSQLIARPDLYRSLPRRLQDRWSPRAIRPAGAQWLKDRLRDIPIRLQIQVVSATPTSGQVRLRLSGGADRVVDHVLFATGYRVDLNRYAFLPRDVIRRIDHVNGYPRLGRGFETSMPGLHILGAPAAWSYGPLMRFVAGSDYAARTLTRGLDA